MQKFAYLKHPVTGERKAQFVSQGFRILDLKFAPDEPQDGDHVDDNAAEHAGAHAGIGTDSGDQFSDEQLREIITEATGTAPHHKTGRAKLVEQFNELNADAADNSNDTGDDNAAEHNPVE